MDRSGEQEATKDHQTVITCTENNARTAAIEAQASQEYDYKLFKHEIQHGSRTVSTDRATTQQPEQL